MKPINLCACARGLRLFMCKQKNGFLLLQFSTNLCYFFPEHTALNAHFFHFWPGICQRGSVNLAVELKQSVLVSKVGGLKIKHISKSFVSVAEDVMTWVVPTAPSTRNKSRTVAIPWRSVNSLLNKICKQKNVLWQLKVHCNFVLLNTAWAT
jgi:hypothetical protein